jgi:hypothetical protein
MRIKEWNAYRKAVKNHPISKILVLLDVIKSPSWEFRR